MLSTRITCTLGIVLAKQDETLKSEQELAVKQQLLQLQVLRPYYPLEPLTISYQITFSMDDPAFKSYLDRVERDIVRDWNANRGPEQIEMKTPGDIKAPLNLSNTKYKWLPGEAPGEEAAAIPIRGFGYQFNFSTRDKPDEKRIELLCASSNQHINTYSKYPPQFDFELGGDFSERTFTEDVECQNPYRTGNDGTAFSVLDLIGLTMTWNASPANSKLVSIGFRFANDVNVDDRSRRFYPVNATSLVMDPFHLGMEPIYKQLLITH